MTVPGAPGGTVPRAPAGGAPGAGPGVPPLGPGGREDGHASGLRRFREARPAGPPGCEMCAEPLGDRHAHAVNVENRALLCACRACGLLLSRGGTVARGRYRAVPERYLNVPSFRLEPADWDDLQIPVRMAFFFRNSVLDQFVAFYPSPGGATESLLPLATWDRVLAANPGLPDALPDVEASWSTGGRTGSPATWCRSTPATSWSDSCGRTGRASTAAGGVDGHRRFLRGPAPARRGRTRSGPGRRTGARERGRPPARDAHDGKGGGRG